MTLTAKMVRIDVTRGDGMRKWQVRILLLVIPLVLLFILGRETIRIVDLMMESEELEQQIQEEDAAFLEGVQVNANNELVNSGYFNDYSRLTDPFGELYNGVYLIDWGMSYTERDTFTQADIPIKTFKTQELRQELTGLDSESVAVIVKDGHYTGIHEQSPSEIIKQYQRINEQ